MQPRMSKAELCLFESFAKCSDNYLEFGSGGSTALAANLVRSSIISVDSSVAWQQKVLEYCKTAQTKLTPHLLYIDIGSIKDWGYPTDETNKASWINYTTQVWFNKEASGCDLYLIDGRFRVASFLQVVLHCEENSIVLFHDFSSRSQYHVVKEIAKEIAIAEDLSAFQISRRQFRTRAIEILSKYEFTPG